MSEPKWLTRAEVERIHDKVIEVGGGSDGLRDASPNLRWLDLEICTAMGKIIVSN
jgi:hypothetical protein